MIIGEGGSGGANIRKEITEMLKSLNGKSSKKLIADRRKKFLDMGMKALVA